MAPVTQPRQGRPSEYTDEIAATICGKLADGMVLAEICKLNGMPSTSTVFRWMADERYAAFKDNYARAHEAGLELMADEMLAIADDTSKDTITDEEGNERCNSEWINRSRLRVDTRKWLIAKRLPKKYGERQQVEHSGQVTLDGIIGQTIARGAKPEAS